VGHEQEGPPALELDAAEAAPDGQPGTGPPGMVGEGDLEALQPEPEIPAGVERPALRMAPIRPRPLPARLA